MKEASEAQTLQPVDGLAHQERTDDSEVLVRVENLSKKFCRNLKRSLWYGVQDMSGEVFGRSKKDTLRKDEFWALKDVNFELRRGECLGLIGHNGAGKSTLLKMLNGLIKPDQGRIEMNGRVGALIELGAGFNPVLTGRENVYINGQILGFSKKEIDEKYEAIVEFAEIQEFMESPVQSYSSGMKVRLGFAIAAQMEPDILIIDEVLAVGDASFRIKCFNKIREVISKASVILVSHSMPSIVRVCDKLMLLNHGEKAFYGYEINLGMNKYYSFLPLKKNSNQYEGKLRIIGFSINGQTKLAEPIRENEKVDIALNLMFIENVKNIIVSVAFSDMDMVYFAQVQSEVLQVQKKEERLTISLEELSFSTGKYTIGIEFYEVCTEERFSKETTIPTEKLNVIARYENYKEFYFDNKNSSRKIPVILFSKVRILE